MDWSKAKTTLILVFIITNAFLLFQTFHFRDSNRVSAAMLDGTKKILESNKVTVDCKIPATKGNMEEATFIYGFELEKTLKSIMDNGKYEIRNIRSGTEYYTESRSLIIKHDGGYILKDQTDVKNLVIGNARYVEKHARDLAAEYGIILDSFKVEELEITPDTGYHLHFRGLYKNGLKIYNNYTHINVSVDGKFIIEWFHAKPTNLASESRQILPATDILLGNLIKMYGHTNKEVQIGNIELCYFLDPHIMGNGGMSTHYQTASLVWRVEVQEGSTVKGMRIEGEHKDLLFNAYSGELIEEVIGKTSTGNFSEEESP